MSKRTLHFLLMLLVGIVGCILFYFLCPCCNKGNDSTKNLEKENTPAVAPVTNTEAHSKVQTATSNAFALTDSDGDFSYKANEHFNFNINGFNPLTPINPNVDTGIAKLKAYLTEHPEKTLDVIGLYTSKETNNSAFPNLGIARANAVKNYFVAKGIDSKHLNTKGKLNDDLVPNNSIYQGPLEYHFNTYNSLEEEEAALKIELDALKKEIQADPLMLYFDTGSSNISLTANQRAKMAKMVRYVDKADDGEIDVTGHTDNTGNKAANIKLGLSRANKIKDYFVRNGISSEKIKTFSEGPNKPIATNNTPEGRNKNRRVEVTIK